jgi:hypothetical protein
MCWIVMPSKPLTQPQNTQLNGNISQSSESQFDLQRLIDFLLSNFCTETDVIVRAMLQKVHKPAKRWREFQGEDEVGVKVDRIAETVAFTSNGAGIKEYEDREYFSAICRMPPVLFGLFSLN